MPAVKIDGYSYDDLKEIFTVGGCGLLVRALLRKIPGSVPVMRFDKNGCPTHAAIKTEDGIFIHFGDSDNGFREVTETEIEDAIRYDFREPLSISTRDCVELAETVAEQIARELNGD